MTCPLHPAVADPKPGGFAPVRRIIGLVDPANTASARVLQQLDFTYVGVVSYHGDNAAKYVNRRA